MDRKPTARMTRPLLFILLLLATLTALAIGEKERR